MSTTTNFGSEVSETGNLPTRGGFNFLKIDIKYTVGASGGAYAATSGIEPAISRLTIQQDGVNRLDLKAGELTDAVSALNRGGRYGANLTDLIYDDTLASVADGATGTGRSYFYVPLVTSSSSSMNVTVGITPNLIKGGTSTNLSSFAATVSFALVAGPDAGQVNVIVVPTADELSSRVTIPEGRVQRVVLHDSQGTTTTAYNVSNIRLPGVTFTTPAQLVGAWHRINGDGYTNEDKYMAYTYPFVARSGDTMEIQRSAKSSGKIYFVMGA